MAALELENVTLVGNDTGGALCQLVAAHHPERLARLVLTPCDAYENFLPPAFRPLQLLARIPGATYPILQSMRLAPARRLPIAFGWVTKRADDELTRSWMQPAIASRKIRADTAAVLRGMVPPHTPAAAERFRSARYWTVSVPSIPAWRWPGTEQKNLYVPGLSVTDSVFAPPVKVGVAPSFEPEEDSIVRLCSIGESFVYAIDTLPALAL